MTLAKTCPVCMTPPFHKLHKKKLDDRVKIPRHPADESRGYYYGTVINGRRCLFDESEFELIGKGLIVEWDEDIPFLGKYSDLSTAIKDTSCRAKPLPKRSPQILQETHN